MALNENYKIEYLPIAVQDMNEIVSSFLMMGSKNGAIRIKDKMKQAAQRLGTFPRMSITVPDEALAKIGYRMTVVEDYLMFYRVFDDEKKIIIYRVLNGKMDYPSIMKRLTEQI